MQNELADTVLQECKRFSVCERLFEVCPDGSVWYLYRSHNRLCRKRVGKNFQFFHPLTGVLIYIDFEDSNILLTYDTQYPDELIDFETNLKFF